jgi:hypothetical protein
MPFVFWHAAISIEDLGRDLRLALLAVAFHIFRNWLRITLEQTRREIQNPKLPGAKFFVEVSYLIRYLNLIIFLSHTVRDYSELSLNRIGTHPVENLFGLVLVAYHIDHSWDRFLAAVAKGRLMDEIPSLNDIKPPHCRDFSVAGVKTSDPNDQIEHLVIPELRDRGVSYADYLAGAMTQSAKRKVEIMRPMFLTAGLKSCRFSFIGRMIVLGPLCTRRDRSRATSRSRRSLISPPSLLSSGGRNAGE